MQALAARGRLAFRNRSRRWSSSGNLP